MVRFIVPLAIFMALVAIFGYALHKYGDGEHSIRDVDSPFINKPAPEFKVSQLQDFQQTFAPKDNLGKVWMLNVWASWCVACREEHPLMVQMAKRGNFPVYGLNYKDRPDDAKRWLDQFGNPYVLSAVDFDGKVGIDYGVYGVPETFIIDKQGVIRHKVIGPMNPHRLNDCVMPLIDLLTKDVPQDNPEMKKVMGQCA